ncbi:hypothetical protein ADK64_37860 [Streptomyces sp. MMG1121]|nr:hypothetical protein ADK64_37860 [Streptomyces sp. MMG1121]
MVCMWLEICAHASSSDFSWSSQRWAACFRPLPRANPCLVRSPAADSLVDSATRALSHSWV